MKLTENKVFEFSMLTCVSPTSDAYAEILKTLIFPRALQKLQNRVNFSFFSYLKLFCFSIIKKMMFIVSVKPN